MSEHEPLPQVPVDLAARALLDWLDLAVANGLLVQFGISMSYAGWQHQLGPHEWQSVLAWMRDAINTDTQAAILAELHSLGQRLERIEQRVF